MHHLQEDVVTHCTDRAQHFLTESSTGSLTVGGSADISLSVFGCRHLKNNL
jgi:hypothetical protein